MKLIVNSTRSGFVNLHNVSNLYISTGIRGGAEIVAELTSCDKVVLGRYRSPRDANAAFQLLLMDLRNKDICYINQGTTDNAPA